MAVNAKGLFREPVFWAWAESADAERWQGPFATKREAIAHGHDNPMPYGAKDEFTSYGYIAQAQWPDAGEFADLAVDMDDLLTRMNEQDEAAFWDDELFTAAPGAEDALREAVSKWAREFVHVEAWSVVGPSEEVLAPDAVADTDGKILA